VAERGVAVGAQAVYDAVARAYDGQFSNEVDAKPLDRGLRSALPPRASSPKWSGPAADCWSRFTSTARSLLRERSTTSPAGSGEGSACGYFLDPSSVLASLQAAGFALVAKLERQPWPDVEYPSRRCYLLCQRS